MSNSTLTSKGQTTIPLDVREALGLRPGMRLIFEVSGGTAVIRPQPEALSAFGVLKNSLTNVGFQEVREVATQQWAAEAAAEGAK